MEEWHQCHVDEPSHVRWKMVKVVCCAFRRSEEFLFVCFYSLLCYRIFASH